MFLCTDCTHTDGEDAMEIWELLGPSGGEADNECRWRWGTPAFPARPPTQACTAFAFGRDCSRITSSIAIRFAMGASFSVDSAESRMSEFLKTLGIGDVVEMTKGLTIENVGVNIDAPLVMDFFPNLQRVNVLTIIGNPITPVLSRRFFVAFPGLKKLDQAGGVLVARTTLAELSSLSGLRCVGGMRLEDNVLLSSLEGIKDMQVGIEELRVGGVRIDLEVARQTELRGTQSLAPLQLMAGCDGGRVPGGTLIIDTTCPATIDSWSLLCRILQNSDCGTPPPPPDSSPPPPLDSPPPPTT
jgi:hypothetical protein